MRAHPQSEGPQAGATLSAALTKETAVTSRTHTRAAWPTRRLGSPVSPALEAPGSRGGVG